MSIEKGISSRRESDKKVEAQKWFQQLIQPENLVGDLYSINYETARIIIHDKHKHDVGGIPSLSFLIASRVDTNNSNIDFKAEDSSFILLRVKDAAALPQDKEAERIRVETAQRISGETDKNWDDASSMDVRTKNLLSFAGVECRIIGTFFLEENPQDSEAPLNLKFGSDISNYYPNRGLKVYKPNGKALELIVNYSENIQGKTVKLGQVRYASTNRKYQQIDDVPVYIYPADLLSQKSALFGMTRTGKSNTTKIIAKSVFELRNDDNPLRIGQIIFDPNGEYANENVQDNNSALKNVWQLLPKGQKENEVVTYGITPHPNDPDRIRMLLNFYLDENLPIGKEIINSLLSDDTTTYIKNFLQVNLEKPDENDASATTRHKRRVLAYRSILARAGFPVPKKYIVSTKSLFNKDLLSAMENSTSDNSVEYKSAAKVFGTDNPTLQQLAGAFESLDKFIRENKEYKNFETAYVQKSKSGNTWADEDLKKIIGIFQYPNGTRKIGKAVEQHSADTTSDYAEDIYQHLIDGKLVIIDQSTGEPDLNKSSADRIMNKIFSGNKARFIKGDTNIPEILVYIEEAHNILPYGTDLDTKNIWVRTAKEGAKYRVGMVYATQEVSSIQKNILKNTANWFISHLNNSDETKELSKYYDFDDFVPSIRRAQDKGFLRVKTLSNLFVIPVQVDKFQI
ncbi:MAG: DUF87 domain-containing protein [Candidatus Symbiothrix sp.]|jgi:hypothetical protein|nr:DUF87 domain-containing protein [Candidatus Symbiothrix sp.]